MFNLLKTPKTPKNLFVLLYFVKFLLLFVLLEHSEAHSLTFASPFEKFLSYENYILEFGYRNNSDIELVQGLKSLESMLDNDNDMHSMQFNIGEQVKWIMANTYKDCHLNEDWEKLYVFTLDYYLSSSRYGYGSEKQWYDVIRLTTDLVNLNIDFKNLSKASREIFFPTTQLILMHMQINDIPTLSEDVCGSVATEARYSYISNFTLLCEEIVSLYVTSDSHTSEYIDYMHNYPMYRNNESDSISAHLGMTCDEITYRYRARKLHENSYFRYSTDQYILESKENKPARGVTNFVSVLVTKLSTFAHNLKHLFGKVDFSNNSTYFVNASTTGPSSFYDNVKTSAGDILSVTNATLNKSKHSFNHTLVMVHNMIKNIGNTTNNRCYCDKLVLEQFAAWNQCSYDNRHLLFSDGGSAVELKDYGDISYYLLIIVVIAIVHLMKKFNGQDLTGNRRIVSCRQETPNSGQESDQLFTGVESPNSNRIHYQAIHRSVPEQRSSRITPVTNLRNISGPSFRDNPYKYLVNKTIQACLLFGDTFYGDTLSSTPIIFYLAVIGYTLLFPPKNLFYTILWLISYYGFLYLVLSLTYYSLHRILILLDLVRPTPETIGYCYLYAFSPEIRQELSDCLGPFPLLTTLNKVWESCDPEYKSLRGGEVVHLKRYRYCLHIQKHRGRDTRPVPLATLFRMPFPSHDRMGGFAKLPYEWQLPDFNPLHVTPETLGYCYLSIFPEETRSDFCVSLGPFPELDKVKILWNTLDSDYKFEHERDIIHIVYAKGCVHIAESSSELTTSIRLHQLFLLPLGDNTKIGGSLSPSDGPGYCYSLAVVHGERARICLALGRKPTLRQVSCYVLDNNIPINTSGFCVVCRRNTLHLYEGGGSKYNLWDLTHIYSGDMTVGGRTHLGEVVLYTPTVKLVTLADFLFSISMAAIFWLVYGLISYYAYTLSQYVALVVIGWLAFVLIHGYFFLLFATKFVTFLSKLFFVYRYRNNDSSLELSDFDCGCGGKHYIPILNTELVAGNMYVAAEYKHTTHPAKPDPPLAISPFGSSAPGDNDFNFIDAVDPAPHPLIDAFAATVGVSKDMSHGGMRGDGKVHDRDRPNSEFRALGDGRPEPVPPAAGAGGDARGGVPRPRQAHAPDYLDVCDIGGGPPRHGPINDILYVQPEEHILGVAQITKDKRGRIVGVPSEDWKQRLGEGKESCSNATKLYSDLKTHPKDRPAYVTTKPVPVDIVNVPGNILPGTLPALNAYFGDKTMLADSYREEDPFRQSMLAGAMNVVTESVGPGKVVLVLGYDTTKLHCDGNVACLGPGANGMFCNTQTTINHMEEKWNQMLYYESEEYDLTQTNHKYDEIIYSCPYGYNLPTLCKHGARVKAAKIHIVMPASPCLMADNAGAMPNLYLTFCKSEDGKNVTFNSMENDCKAWTLPMAYLRQFWETEIVFLSKDEAYTASRSIVCSDLMLITFTLTTSVRNLSSNYSLTTEMDQQVQIISYPTSFSNYFFYQRQNCVVDVVPTTIMSSYVGQAQKQKEPNSSMMLNTAIHVAAGTNKGLHPFLHYSSADNARTKEMLDEICKLAYEEKLYPNAQELSRGRFPFLARLNFIGNLSKNSINKYSRLHRFFPTTFLMIETKHICLNVDFYSSPVLYRIRRYPLDESTRLLDCPPSLLMPDGFVSDLDKHPDGPLERLRTNQVAGTMFGRLHTPPANDHVNLNTLGHRTNDKRTLAKPRIWPNTLKIESNPYPTLETLNKTLAECLLIDPHSIPTVVVGGGTVVTPAVYDSFAVTKPMVIIKNNVCTIPGAIPDTQKEITLVTIQEDGSHTFSQLRKNIRSLQEDILSDKVQIEYHGIMRFLAASSFELVDPKATLCFYRAAGVTNPLLVAGSDTICTPEKIREVCIKLGIIIVYRDTIFYPRGWSPDRITKAVFVEGSHAYAANLQKVLNNLNHYKVANVDNWTMSVNGPIEQIPAAKISAPRCETSKEGKKFAKYLELYNTALRKAKGKRNKAVFEYLAYCTNLHVNLISTMEMINMKDAATYHRGLISFSSYDLRKSEFLSKNKLKGKQFGWTGSEFISLRWDRKTQSYIAANNYNGIVLLTADEDYISAGKISEKFASQIGNIRNYDFNAIYVLLKNGVPGCGKTFEILTTHDRQKDTVATATVIAKDEYRTAMQDYPNYQAERYRTYDSILINGGLPTKNLHCDEGYMIHWGQLLLTAMVLSAESIEISGDRRQLPFLPRCFLFNAIHHVPQPDKIIERTVTRRMPKSITQKFKNVYTDITTISQEKGKENVELVTTTPVASADKDKIMTFTQAEKADMMSVNRGSVVNTVHEEQGSQADHVLLVRTKIQNNPIYESIQHLVVATSRHRKSITYMTVDDNDLTSRFLRGELTSEDLEMVPEPERVPEEFYLPTIKPTKYLKLIDLNEKGRLKSPLAEWIMTKAGLTTQSTQSYSIERYNIDYSPSLQDPIDHSVEEVQWLMDQLYERPDQVKQESLKLIQEFPLPPAFRVNYAKLSLAMQKGYNREWLEPRLITPHPRNDTKTIAETVQAIIKRNLEPPRLNDIRPKNTAKAVVDIFFDTYIDKDRFEQSKSLFPFGNINVLAEWLELRSSGQIKKMDGIRYLEGDPNMYSAFLKGMHKSTFTGSHNLTLFAGQILAVHHPLMSALFTEYIRTLAARLKYSLKKNFIINDGYSAEEMNGHVNECLFGHSELKFLEIDFSKFDKSQDDLTLEVNCEIMDRFGVPEWVIKEWEECHVSTTLVFQQFGIKVDTLFQRKSGDVFTFMGNTVTAMAALSYVYDLSEVYLAIFGGDDSLIVVNSEQRVYDRSKILGAVFNLDAKIENYPYGHYFSSRFLLQSNGYWLFVPDPMKIIFKLGRYDMYCEDHIKEYYTSFCDNNKLYNCATVRQKAAKAAHNRYSKYFTTKSIPLDPITDFIGSLLVDPQKFTELYEGEERLMKRKLTPDLLAEFKKQEMQIDSFVELLSEEL